MDSKDKKWLLRNLIFQIPWRPKYWVLAQKVLDFGIFWLQNHKIVPFNFDGSEADIFQTSNLQNGLFFASSNKAFKSLEILKLIKNWILSFRAIYQNVQASVKFWYQIQIIRYFIAAEISHYLMTVFYDHPVQQVETLTEVLYCQSEKFWVDIDDMKEVTEYWVWVWKWYGALHQKSLSPV